MSEEDREDQIEESGADAELTPDQLAEIQQKAAERDDFLDKLQRTRADYLNYQKRAKKDREQVGEFAVQGFVSQLAPLINDLDRAIQAGEESHDLSAFFEGMKLLHTQLYKILAENGIEPIETVGSPFDPAYHEAMMQQESDEHPENHVVAELQRGFTMNGRTIVPARVAVAVAPARPDAAEEAPGDDIEKGD